ncbi:MAG TPA: 2,3-diaminopropionate biosynthesis protein SbnB [Amycolatopsis sp.]|uniref:2,3-diaminopropionate biosynthesis protein SbnB n=1 Tax=Amycolatopsis sp. TaxID=37632 RepID=UPI002B4644C7|nr:2,3-diaminopropionate biosynthesis protein SbnB [Amycolatopsis sp.]HKS47176.1 2,3-diaminopropionate biosynthesis protein SbnB [Amycolatopsis sp.]
MSQSEPNFAVISGEQVSWVLTGRERAVVDLVEAAYRAHGRGETENPPSCIHRLPGRPLSRIIALPASLGGDVAVDGIKWVSSFPGNVVSGLPRASAVLVLNDHETGYPFACIESSIISAARTAASATLAADWLTRGRDRPRTVGFFGAGLIARYVHTYLAATGWSFDRIGVYDKSAASAGGFHEYLERSGAGGEVEPHDRAEDLVRSSDLVVFATVAAMPHVTEIGWFDHDPVVLHVSLRDLAPEILLASTNIVDDVDHCLRARTSAHLAEQLAGNRSFVAGTLDEVMTGKLRPKAGERVIFSPFGLGVLDLMVGKYIYDELAAAAKLSFVDGFFHDLSRYGPEEKASSVGGRTLPRR